MSEIGSLYQVNVESRVLFQEISPCELNCGGVVCVLVVSSNE